MGWETTPGTGPLALDGDLRFTVSTPQTAFHAYKTTAQSLFANSLHTLGWGALFTAVNSGAFDVTSGKFTAPDCGNYAFAAGVQFTNVASGTSLDLYLTRNGSTILRAGAALVASMGRHSLGLSLFTTLVQSDYVQVGALSLLAGAQADSGAMLSWFSGGRAR